MDKEDILKNLYSKIQKSHDFLLGPVDTDSISIGKVDGSPYLEEEQNLLINEINNLLPEYIQYANDGYFQKIIVLKAKNYVLFQNNKIKTKGSSLKSSKTEKGLKEFMGEIISSLVYDKQSELLNIYYKYVKEVHNVKDIARWCSKKTITEAVLNPTRTTEQKILDALNGQEVQMGNKIYVYFNKEKNLQLQENWDAANPNHNTEVLLSKLYKTLVIFKNVISIEQFTKFHLKNKKVKELLNEILSK